MKENLFKAAVLTLAVTILLLGIFGIFGSLIAVAWLAINYSPLYILLLIPWMFLVFLVFFTAFSLDKK